jgi:hypothetical protein
MIDGLGVAGWGVGGIEAEATMLGQVNLKRPPLSFNDRLTIISICADGKNAFSIFFSHPKLHPHFIKSVHIVRCSLRSLS